MGITSPNHPRFRVVRNVIGESACSGNGHLELILVGGQEEAIPSEEWSPRDPYGAIVKATCGDETRLFQLSGGQGLSTINAKRVHIGMGERKKINKLEVLWPSGKTTVLENVEATGRLKILENTQ